MKAYLRPISFALLAGLSVFAVSARATTYIDTYWNFGTGTGTANHVSNNVTVMGAGITAFNFDALYTPAFDTSQPTNPGDYSGLNGRSGMHNASMGVNSVAGPITALNINTASYFQFTLTPDPGLQLVATDFELGTRSRTGFGPQTITLVASTDGFATFNVLGSTSVVANSTWTLASIPSFAFSATIDTPVTFRIYGTDGTGGTSFPTWRIDDVTLSVVAVPEPSTYASLFVGVVLLGARALRRRKSAVA
jgi:hypothetical protein